MEVYSEQLLVLQFRGDSPSLPLERLFQVVDACVLPDFSW
jgi:hypothetical protein